MMNTFLRELFELTNSIIMSIPIHILRLGWMKLLMSHLGKNACFLRHIRLHTPWRINIGDNVVVNLGVMLDGRKGLKIGKNVDIGEYVCIWTLQHSINDGTHSLVGAPVIIEDNVWIAPHSIILPGTVIGEGGVVSTGSVVTKDVPPHTLVGGVPAKVIKTIPPSTFIQDYNVFL